MKFVKRKNVLFYENKYGTPFKYDIPLENFLAEKHIIVLDRLQRQEDFTLSFQELMERTGFDQSALHRVLLELADWKLLKEYHQTIVSYTRKEDDLLEYNVYNSLPQDMRSVPQASIGVLTRMGLAKIQNGELIPLSHLSGDLIEKQAKLLVLFEKKKAFDSLVDNEYTQEFLKRGIWEKKEQTLKYYTLLEAGTAVVFIPGL